MPKKSTSPVLTIRDTSGDLHAAAARISRAMTGNTDYSAGVVHALSFTDTYYRRLSKPIDYANTPIDILRDYCVHGYDFTVRAPALAEIERRNNADLLNAARDAANQLRTVAALLNHIPAKYAAEITSTIRYGDIDEAIKKAEVTK